MDDRNILGLVDSIGQCVVALAGEWHVALGVETKLLAEQHHGAHVAIVPELPRADFAELCWWAIRCDVVAALPDGMARKSLRMPDEVIQSVTRESDIVPAVQATGIVLAKAQSVDTAFGITKASRCRKSLS